jgi:MFS superfamily sulfate permease-like transporter
MRCSIWYNGIGSVLHYTRFPTPHKKGAGATDRHGNLYNLKTLLTLFLTVLLLVFAAWQEGVTNMISAVAIEFAVHLAITVGSRVKCRTRISTERQDNLPFLLRLKKPKTTI